MNNATFFQVDLFHNLRLLKEDGKHFIDWNSCVYYLKQAKYLQGSIQAMVLMVSTSSGQTFWRMLSVVYFSACKKNKHQMGLNQRIS